MSAGPFRRVLAGWDCSAGSAAGLRAAAAIADGETGRVVALAVLRLVPRGESEEDRGAEVASLRHQARESFGKARDTLPDALRARVSLEPPRRVLTRPGRFTNTRTRTYSSCLFSASTGPGASCARG
jgi:hypothetical protein